MSLAKLGPKLQKKGSQGAAQVDDKDVQSILLRIEQELRAMRLILTEMSDIKVDLTDIGEDYEN